MAIFGTTIILNIENDGDKNKNLPEEYLKENLKEYLNQIKSYLQKSGAWNCQLTIAINFISSKDADEENVMHLKSDNTEFMTHDNANDIVDELSESRFSR